MLPLTPEDETDVAGDPESATAVPKIVDVPVPSPGKYVIMKKYKLADSPSTAAAPKRSATLSTTGRSFTASDKTAFRKPGSTFATSKSVAESRPPAKRLVKGVSSKKSTVHYSLYDESFIRYVNELDSYFKASELRYQSSKDAAAAAADGGDDDAFSLVNHVTGYSTDASSSFEASSGGGTSDSAYFDGEQRSYSLDSPRRYRRAVPRISLNSCNRSSPELELPDSSRSLSENASFYTTPEQDISFVTTPDFDSLSVCITPSLCTASEQSCYLTAAEHRSLDENTDTFVMQLHQQLSSSQETLFNAVSEYEDTSYHSTVAATTTTWNYERAPELDENATANALAALDLGSDEREASVREDVDSDADSRAASALSRQQKKVAAKIRRSNFVRSTCIDLEEDECKSEPPSAAAVTLDDNDDDDDDDEEETKKESYLKCCPV